MMADSWVVGHHEMRNIVVSHFPGRGAIVVYAFSLIILGLIVPIGIVIGRLDSAGYFFVWFCLVWLLIASPSSDAFAGERERHTLTYLLSTRLPTSSILTGKIAAVALYGLVLTMVAIIVSAVVLFISSEWLHTEPAVFFLYSITIITPATAVLAATSGALVSLTARSARQAQQATTIIAILAVALLAAVRYLVGAFAPSLLNSYARCIVGNPCKSYALTATILVMLALSILVYWLAAIRLERIRCRPS